MVQPMFKGQTYGEATKQREAVRAVPTQAPPTEPASAVAPRPVPGKVADLNAVTTRPNEPVTSGNPLGAGPGPEILPQRYTSMTEPGSRQDLIHAVRYAYSKYPNSALMQLIMELENVQ